MWYKSTDRVIPQPTDSQSTCGKKRSSNSPKGTVESQRTVLEWPLDGFRKPFKMNIFIDDLESDKAGLCGYKGSVQHYMNINIIIPGLLTIWVRVRFS